MTKKIGCSDVLLIDIDTVIQQQLCLQSYDAGLNPLNLGAEQYHQYHQHERVCLIIVDAKSHGNQIISKVKNIQPLIYPQSQDYPPILALADARANDLAGVYQCGARDYISCPLISSEVKLRITQALHHDEINRSVESTEQALRHNAAALLAEATAAYLNSQLANEVNLVAVAKIMGVNRNKLTAAFKTCFGTSVIQWFREQRMLMAAKLLTTTTDSILQIAGQVGYPDSNYFSTVFKRAFRLSPLQYRKKQQSKPVLKTKILVHKTKVANQQMV
ncbi:MAG: AraC-like DNA-binding protein [Phenylobacterium sp.]